jgi:hypothetical protein
MYSPLLPLKLLFTSKLFLPIYILTIIIVLYNFPFHLWTFLWHIHDTYNELLLLLLLFHLNYLIK